MNRKIVLMLLAAAVLLVSVGCRKEGTATGPKKSARAPSQGKAGAPESPPPTSVGGQQPGGSTAQAPAGGTAQQPPASPKQPGATAGGTEANQPATPGTTPASTTPASAKSQSGAKK